MNKRDIEKFTEEFALALNILGRKKLKTIYIVKCEVIYYIPAANITRKTNHNLMALSDLNSAKEYIDLAREKLVIDTHIKNGKYSIMIDTASDKLNTEDDTIYERRIKIISNMNPNNCTTKLFRFILETITSAEELKA